MFGVESEMQLAVKGNLVLCPDHNFQEENGLVNHYKPTTKCVIIA